MARTLGVLDPEVPVTVRTVYLGQFEHDNAEAIAERLEAAGIAWYHKQVGRFVQRIFLGEWGVRLYVEDGRVDEAQAIVASVVDAPPPS